MDSKTQAVLDTKRAELAVLEARVKRLRREIAELEQAGASDSDVVGGLDEQGKEGAR